MGSTSWHDVHRTAGRLWEEFASMRVAASCHTTPPPSHAFYAMLRDAAQLATVTMPRRLALAEQAYATLDLPDQPDRPSFRELLAAGREFARAVALLCDGDDAAWKIATRLAFRLDAELMVFLETEEAWLKKRMCPTKRDCEDCGAPCPVETTTPVRVLAGRPPARAS